MEVKEMDYGPLKGLIGKWTGDKGMDIAPDPDGDEENPYYETITYEAGDDLKNAETQILAVLFYRQIVKRKSNDEVFHDQCGYWTWDGVNKTIAHSFCIPRGVCVNAGTKYDKSSNGTDVEINVFASVTDSDWSIVQSPFMQKFAKTTSFELDLRVSKDRLNYKQTSMVDIYGKSFTHTDENQLSRVQ